MPGVNASEIRVAGTGRVLVAAVGSAPPDDLTKDWSDPPWRDLGYTTSDGVKLTKKDKLHPVDTWQTVAAAPQVSERTLAVEFHDGPSVTHRFVIPRGVVTDTDEAAFSRNTAVKLGVTFTALTPLTGNADPLAIWTMSAAVPPATAARKGS